MGYRATNGIRAIMRARFMAFETCLWCFAQRRVFLRGSIFACSDKKFLRKSASLRFIGL
jgi:hypothetical protein